MGRLQGRVALVTGGGRGIGKGIALRYAEEGAKVAVAQRDKQSRDDTVSEIQAAGGTAISIPMDVANRESVQKAVDEIVGQLGRIDTLVNNAGMGWKHGSFFDLTDEVWDEYIAINLKGIFIVSQIVARKMVDQGQGGRVVNIGSVQSYTYQPGFTAYSTSKGGVLMFTKALAKELAPYDIAVNMIAPGPIKIERNVDMHASDEFQSIIDTNIPAGRSGLPVDCANAAVYLGSEECSFVTGTSILVDGGILASLPF